MSLDRVRAGDHPRDQRAHLHAGRNAGSAGHAQVSTGQRGQPCPLGQRQHRHQPGARHEIRVIERSRPSRRSMR